MSDKGTVCRGGDGAKGEKGEVEGRTAAEWNRQASTPLVFSLHKARPPCVRNLSFNLIPHTSSSLGEEKKKKNT